MGVLNWEPRIKCPIFPLLPVFSARSPHERDPELPPRLRRLLHRPLDQQLPARPAARQARRTALPASRRSAALPPVRPPRAPAGLRLAAAQPRNVRRDARAGHVVSGAAGTGNATGLNHDSEATVPRETHSAHSSCRELRNDFLGLNVVRMGTNQGSIATTENHVAGPLQTLCAGLVYDDLGLAAT